MLFDIALSGKFVRTNEVKCDKCHRPWELCSLLGCLDLLLFHNAFVRGESCLSESVSKRTLSSEVDIEIMVTLLGLGPKSYFSTEQFRITNGIRRRFPT